MVIAPPGRVDARIQLCHILLTMNIEALKDHAFAVGLAQALILELLSARASLNRLVDRPTRFLSG